MIFQVTAFASPETEMLKASGWTKEQAQGLVASINHIGGPSYWKPEYRQKLFDWCSAHEKISNTHEGQLEFIAYELRNSYEGIGRQLDKATTIEQAQDAVEPYARLLCATR